ncbi:hypothetical protein OR221_0364 [Microbacterium laevaniformans OR221]|jgi:hypothetical protein|nr:hypothetical protein OR221_0364 [Microbacterium laevaniformans OR221]
MTRPRSHDERFTMVPDWLIESDLSLHDYVVLLVLMKHGRTTGRCNPGFATIARQARVSRDTVMRALRSLETSGLIEIERRRVGTKNLSNEYALHVDRERASGATGHVAPNGSQRVVAPSDHPAPDGSRSQPLGVVAEGDQGWSLGATLTRPTNESYERDDAVCAAPGADADVIEAEIVDDDMFDRVWAVWPKKASKKIARLKFAAAAKRHPRGEHGLVADIVEHAGAYVQHAHPVQFVPMLSTWLNGDRWEDSLPGPRSERKTQEERNAEVFARYA